MRNLFALLALALAMLGQIQAAENAESYLAEGNTLVANELFNEAAAAFQRALDLNPMLTRARYQLAVCLFALGRNEEARTEFEAVKKIAGQSHEVDYYLGRIDLLAGNANAAVAELRPLADDPQIPKASYYLALAYLGQGDQVDGQKWLEKSLTKAPNDYRAHYRLARLYASQGRKEAADKEFQQYNRWRDSAKTTETGLRACAAALDQGEKDSAACAKLSDPNDPEKLVLLGQIYGSHAAYERALEPLKAAVKLDANSYDAWQNLGISYFRLARYGEARMPLERAQTLSPDSFDTLNLLAATLYMLGDDAAALPVVERAHQMKPDDAQLAAVLKQLKAARQ